MEPEILVLDEPFANLDFRGKRMIREIIESVRGEKTVILASHEAEYLTLCDRVALMDDGGIITVGPPEEVLGEVELLREHNLDVPPIVELFQALGLKVPRDVEEAKVLIDNLLRGR
jgi:cobalt/nickel transport system ATP-binding protein